MQKLGRNDLCHCGSGKKYKKCCMEQDQADNVTRITRSEPDAPSFSINLNSPDEFSEEDALNILASDWANPLYQMIAQHIFNHMRGRYDWLLLTEALVLWHSYSTDELPVTKKAGVFAAAIEYSIAVAHDLFEVTQDELAERYGVSTSTISRRSQQIIAYTEENMVGFLDEEDDEEWDYAPPSRESAEQTLHQLGSILNEQNFDTPEEVQAFIENLLSQQGEFDFGRKAAVSSPKQQAEELLFDARQQPSPALKIKLAKQALTHYPDSPDAYNILAENEAKNLVQSSNLYKQGILAGERELRNEMKEHKGHFWGMVNTRPYMRAKYGYAESCQIQGRTGEAIKHLEHMLELNPNDNQGARYLLVAAYLQEKRYETAAKIINNYDESGANFNYDRMLIEYGLRGITSNLAKLYKLAYKQNPYVPQFLLGKKRLPDSMPESMGCGDENEAVEYCFNHTHLWNRDKQLLQWLAKQ